jgi:hypothetical protein
MKLKLEKPGLVELDPSFIHPNFDAKAVRRLVRNYENSMKSEMDAALNSAQREVEVMGQLVEPGLFTFDKKKADELGEKTRKEVEALASEEPPTAETVSGHNPNLYPPFFNSFRAATIGGVVTTPIFRPRPEAGALNLSVAAYPPGGHIDRQAWMGAFTVAPSTEMATASVSAFVGGTVFAISALGYGRASARLMVSILADGPSGFRAVTGTALLGDLALGLTRIPLTSMSASAGLMVNAGDLLLISCGLRVTAGCGGLVCSATSNIALSGTVLCLF